MMTLLPPHILDLCQRADTINNQGRLDIFEFLAQQFSVIPLRGGFPSADSPSSPFKAPMENGWQQWCREKRPFNRSEIQPERAGVACGPASGILVLDVDDVDAFHSWCYLNDIKKGLPITFTVRTGGEGKRFHFYFQYPTDGQTYKNRSLKGVFDIRGEGGQIVCPGSLHPETRKPYTIENNVPIALPPEWLLEYSLTKRTPADLANAATTNQPSEQIKSDQEQTMNNIPSDIAFLPVSPEIKSQIVTPIQKGNRSEASMKVLIGLLSAGVDMGTIQSIYSQYPVGDKSREEKPEWFAREVQKAQEHIALVRNEGNTPTNPFTSESIVAPKATYRAMSALEVVNAQVNFSFLIDKFWPEGEPLMITGHGGAGKSLLTLQIAMDLVNPTPPLFLDTFKPIGQHKVLFVQSENSILGIKRRLQIIRTGYSIGDDVLGNNMVFLGVGNDIRTAGDLMQPRFTEVIEEHIQKYQTDILVIDPLISFHSLNENSNDEMRRLLDSVSLFCEGNGVTPLLIHHHSKAYADSGAGGGRGASAIGDWSANTWELSGNTTKGYTLEHKKARNFELQDKLDLVLDHLRFKKGAGSTKAATGQHVVEALQNLGGTANTMKDLQTELINVHAKSGNTISVGTARNHILKAVSDGTIQEQPGNTPNSKQYTL
jgi:archaellum biogenesis ATPase FlaH